MTTEQEALRLAERLSNHEIYPQVVYENSCPELTSDDIGLLDESAAMLRKLVAEREADRAAMREALEALKYHTEQTRPIVATQVAIHHLRQRLEGTTPPKNAVWVVRSYSKTTNHRVSESVDLDSYEKAVALRNQWEANPDFSIGMYAEVERLGQ